MFFNYLKIAFRNILKDKIFSTINILGLAIGIAACLLIMLHVQDELTFDAYHQNSERIYRINMKLDDPERGVATFARSSNAIAATLEKECPAVEQAARLSEVGGSVVCTEKNTMFFEQGSIYKADPSLFEILSIPFVLGNLASAFNLPNNILLSEQTAMKYFGHTNVINEVLYFNENMHDKNPPQKWIVSGVFEDIPRNSHLPQIQFIIPMQSNESFSTDDWTMSSAVTYIRIAPGAEPNAVESEINRIASLHFSPQEGSQQYSLQSLRDIHLHSDFRWEYAKLGSFNEIILFSVIAFLVLAIACLNFINLSTAQSSVRAREIGIRKVVGAHRSALIRQFIAESVITAIISLAFAVFIVELLLPYFNNYLGKSLAIHYFSNPVFIFTAFLSIFLIGIVAGVFPAVILSSFKPLIIIRGLMPLWSKNEASGNRKNTLRNTLVVCQFVVSLVLIISSLFIHRQILFMKNKDLGFRKEQMLVIPTQSVQMSQTIYQQFESIKSEFLQDPGVATITIQSAAPGRDKLTEKIRRIDEENSEGLFACIEFTDANYLESYDIPLVAGRDFQAERSTDSGEAFVINETAVQELGFSTPEEALGQRLSVWFWQGAIIGVVKDFHFRSLHRKIGPLVCFTPKFNPEYFTVRLNTQNMPQTLDFLKNKWASFFPENPFEYYFLDEAFDGFYQSEEKLGTLLPVFTELAIFIACLGLFGLAYFTTQRRTKEIGVRKVLGASVANISIMLSKEYTKWVVFANLIAWPVAWYVVQRWLQNFAYRIEISWWIFVFAGGLVLLIALLTVGWQVIRVANANPVETLRYE